VKNHSYEAQRAATKQADAEHEQMLIWYAQAIGCDRSDIKNQLVRLTKTRAKQLYKQYQEQK
jgi:hypothetical protein